MCDGLLIYMENLNIDELFMRLALKQARLAAKYDEVPVGAVLVIDNQVIARGYNKKEKNNDVTSHAEIEVIRKASKKASSWRLEDATIYVTLEPCSMCAGALLWSRVKRIVYGASEPKFGALGSTYNLFVQKNINHQPLIQGGILEEECGLLLKDFFKNKRENKCKH